MCRVGVRVYGDPVCPICGPVRPVWGPVLPI